MQKEDYVDDYLQAGYRLFPVNGKIPAQKGWQNVKENPFLDPRSFTKNYGICLQTDDLVIDVDVSEKEDGTNKVGRRSFDTLVQATELDFKNTCGVKTGTGGFHFYLKKPRDVKIRKSLRAYPDIDFLSKGNYVVGAGSLHPQTNKPYIIVVGGILDVQPAPQALLDLLEVKEIDFDEDFGLKRYVEDKQSIGRCRKFLKDAEPAVEGVNGDKNTYIIACRCRAFGLSPQLTLDMLLDYWNPRCEPPWDADELKEKVYNAYKYDTVPQGVKHPENDFKDIPEKKKYIWLSPRRADGSHKPGLKHAVNYMELDGELDGLFKFNLFTEEIEFTRPPTWYPKDKTVVPWTDNDAVSLKFHLATRNKFEANTTIISEAAYIAALETPYHPLRDYLNDVKWDGVKRIETWLHDYAGVPDNEYTKIIGEKTLLAAVARIFEPGCKFDNILVIEGAQGAGKSRLVAALGMDWYGDLLLDPHNKDTVAAMRNKWIIEVSEMEFVKKAEINAMKAFLSRNVDRHRLSHRRNAEDYPRQCIFIGTINPDQGGGYLRDNTGNRRFWPVTVPEGYKVKVDKMERDIDQIWAETMHLYKSGAACLHIEDADLAEIAEAEANKRRPKDLWFDTIKNWLDIRFENGEQRNHVKSMEIYTDCLNGIPRNITRAEQTRITQVMKELKWRKGSYRVGNKTIAGYIRPRELREEDL